MTAEKMDKRPLRLMFNAKIKPVKSVNNDEFTLCKCYIMGLGANRNGSYFDKETVDAAMPTLYNIPVVGHLFVNEDGEYQMGGHDSVVVEDGVNPNGSKRYKLKSVCVPYGVVPANTDITYENVREADGSITPYLCADVLLWTGRFEDLKKAIYDEEIYFGQSMEINVNAGELVGEGELKNYFKITDYSYSALCLLGKSDDPEKHVEPCFPSSRVEPYEFALNDSSFVALMSQLKEELAATFVSGKENALDEKQKGETVMENNIQNEPEIENVTEEPVANFEQKDAVEAENTQEIAEQAESEEANTDSNEEFSENSEDSSEPEIKEETPVNFTFVDKFTALAAVINRYERFIDENEQEKVIYTNLMDFDDKFAYYNTCTWNAKDGQDTENKNYRVSYIYDIETKTASIGNDAVEVFTEWVTNEERAELDTVKADYEALKAYKAERIQKDKEIVIDEALAEFEELKDNSEFQEIYANRYSYENVEEIKNACYVIKGKYSIANSTPKDNKVKLSVGIKGVEDESEESSSTFSLDTDKKESLLERFLKTYTK